MRNWRDLDYRELLWGAKLNHYKLVTKNTHTQSVKEAKVKEDVKQAFLAYLFFINSKDKNHSQLKKTMAKDHAKGNIEGYPSSCHAVLTLMNNFKPSWSLRLLLW